MKKATKEIQYLIIKGTIECLLESNISKKSKEFLYTWLSFLNIDNIQYDYDIKTLNVIYVLDSLKTNTLFLKFIEDNYVDLINHQELEFLSKDSTLRNVLERKVPYGDDSIPFIFDLIDNFYKKI